MDTLSTVLTGHRARGADLLRCEMTGPWSLSIEDEAAVGVVVMLRGRAHLGPSAPGSVTPEGRGEVNRPVELHAGDVAIVREAGPYVFADRSGRPPTVVIGPGNVCRSLTGEPLATSMGVGTRTWGNAAVGETAFVTATWELASQVTGRLLDALPTVAVVPAERADRSLADLLAREVQREQPGQDVVLDRLVDLVLVASLRQWFDSPGAEPPSWWAAQGDPVVGRALSALHDRPAEPWTLERLAAECSVSRATLARRFTALVGGPPMTYLTEWRLSIAADLLADGGRSVEGVARDVGYSNAFAFSTAFKRAHGQSPGAFRRRRPRDPAEGRPDGGADAPRAP